MPCMQVGQNTWLAFWSQHTITALQAVPQQPLRPALYLGVYAALAMLAITLQAMRSYWCVLLIRTMRHVV